MKKANKQHQKIYNHKPLRKIGFVVSENGQKRTTAVEDIDKKEPTKTPSDNLAPHNFNVHN